MRYSTSFAIALAASVALSACYIDGIGDQELIDTQRQSLGAQGLSHLDIKVEDGDLHIKGDADLDEIRVTVKVFADRSTVDEQELIDDLQFDLKEGSGNSARLKVRIPNRHFNAHANVIVSLPKRFSLDIEDTSGTIDIKNTQDVDIDDGSGDIFMDQIEGSVRIKDDSGSIDAHNINGDVTISDDSGDIQLTDLHGNVKVNDDSGSIDIYRADGEVDINDGSGDIDISEIKSNVTIHDGSGTIRVRNVDADVEITDGSGDITLDNVPNANILENESGEVHRY